MSMTEIGAGISVGVLAAIVVLVVYLIAGKVGRWQPSPLSAPQSGVRTGGARTAGAQPGYGGGYDDRTQAYGTGARAYDADEAETRVMGRTEAERATKSQLAQNVAYSGQLISQNRRAATSSNGDTLAVITYLAGAALVAAVFFVFFNNLLLPATIGALAGAIICVALASIFTAKTLDFWPDNSTISIINLIVALVASMFVYIGTMNTERDGFNLDQITDSFDPIPFGEGFSGFATAIGDRVVTFFTDYGFTGFVFVLFMAIGCIIVFSLAAKSLVDVMDWRIFAQFGDSVTDRSVAHSRAVRFQSSKVSHTVTSFVLGLIAVLCGTGLLYDAFTWFTR